ncbi:hypothetical protein EC9_35400 [Rosistilla ulvae]|uniref:Uncharacterized protein n=1 Tax=Rosistilla ulvae TaxID=1930277 RepID=A0A517M390_9BACT|nr:hypothetical protein [Rosistilla ulvae]QDS89341.1 hypothetical protein EC9_35400 [Rosistilla ulvae]
MSRNLRLFLCTIATIYGVSRASAQSFLGPVGLAPVAIENGAPLSIVRWNSQLSPQVGTHDTAGPRIADAPQADDDQPVARVAELAPADDAAVAAIDTPELDLVDAPSITSAPANAGEAVADESVLIVETTELTTGESDASDGEVSRDIPTEDFATSSDLAEEYQPYDLPSADIVLVEIYPAEVRVAKNFVELPSDVEANATQDKEAAAENAAVQAPDDDSIDSQPDVATIDAVEEVNAGESNVEALNGADDQPVADYNDDELFELEGWDHAESDNDPSEDSIVPSTDDAATTDAKAASQQAEELGMPQPPAAEIAATDDLIENDVESIDTLEIAPAAAIDPAVEEAEALLAQVLDEIEVEAIMAAEAHDAEALASDVAAINRDLSDAADDLASNEVPADDAEIAFDESVADEKSAVDEYIADEMLAQAVKIDDIVYDNVGSDEPAAEAITDESDAYAYSIDDDYEVAAEEVAADEGIESEYDYAYYDEFDWGTDVAASDDVAADEEAGEALVADDVAGDSDYGYDYDYYDDAYGWDAELAEVDEVAVDEEAGEELAADDVSGDSDYGYDYDYDYDDYGWDVELAQVDEVAVDEVAVDEVAVDEVAVDEVAVDEVAVDEVAVDEVAVDEVAVDEVAVDEVAVDEVAVDEVAVDEVAVDDGYNHDYRYYYDEEMAAAAAAFDREKVEEVASDEAADADVASVDADGEASADDEMSGDEEIAAELAVEKASGDEDVVAVSDANEVPNQCLEDELQWQLSFLAGSQPELQWAANPSQLASRIAAILVKASDALSSLGHPVVAAAQGEQAAIENATTQVEVGPVSECTPVEAGKTVSSLDAEPVAEAIVAPPIQEATIQIAAEPSAATINR